jgi:hypothetical protein
MTAVALAENASQFAGWEKPQSNYFKVPNEFWLIEDLSPHERMVLLYILRHTWGFQEFDVMKQITIDEFQHGRKSGDERIDKGCGVSRGGISQALASLEKKGYIQVMTDVSDPARVKKHYMLNMSKDSVHEMNTAFTTRTQRSRGDNRTEKETIERHLEKEKELPPISPADVTDGKTTDMGGDVHLALVEMKDAVRAHLKQYGRQNEQVAKSLLGLHVGKNADLNLSRKFTPALLERFGLWWDKNHMRDGRPLTRPKNLDSVKSFGEEFLATLITNHQAARIIYADPAPLPSVTDGMVTFNKPPKKEQAS